MKTSDTVIPAWKMAIKNRLITTELIFHSDRGVQYACYEFKEILRANPLVIQSMSRKGNCWDNAVAESFFKTLKTELINHIGSITMAVTKMEVFEFIEIWRPPLRYNRKRIHASLGYLTPVEYEQKLNHYQNAA